MQWSKLKKHVKDRIAASLASSIEINQTRYRHSHDQEGEFWITFGKERIFSAGSLSYLSTLGQVVSENRANGVPLADAYKQAWPVLENKGVMLLEEINKDLFCSLSQTAEEMLEHRNPVIRGLAVVDARYGKRRLELFDPVEEHPLVQRLYRFRCDAEGVQPSVRSLV
jgi:hypothetical protein